MQNSSTSFTNWQTRRNYSNIGGTVTSTTTLTSYSNGRTNSFSFTGFGPSGDKTRKTYVSGTYDITETRQMYGDIFEMAPWYSGQYSSIEYRGNVSGLVSAWPSYYFSFISSASLTGNQLSNWAYNEALSKLWDQIKKSETNIALSLGEGKETYRMLNSTSDLLKQQAAKLGKALSAVSKLKRHIRKEAFRYLRNPSLTLASTHLSVKYGWEPLLRDVWNYADWTYETFSFGVPFRARSKRVVRVSEPWSDSNGYNLVEGKETHLCEIGVTCYVNDPTWFTATRLSSLNPVSIAWELVTLSFVVDWLYDIGSYLENLENALGTGLSFLRGYVTRVAHQQSIHTHVRNKKTLNGSGNWTVQTGQASCSYLKVAKRRDVLTGFPFPVKPTFKLRMGSSRILSAVALSRTVLLGKVR